MKTALSASLQAEDEAVRQRFEVAERLLGQGNPASPPPASEPEVPEVERVIRDSFTLPAEDYELIGSLRQRCLENAVNVSKSELMRAGLHALIQMSDEELVQVTRSLKKVKTGRPGRVK